MCAGRRNRRLADRADRLTPSGCPLPMRSTGSEHPEDACLDDG
jgi:hypothetical protein